ncbi:MAG: methyltransferase domain-containing protein [Gemmatimonadaceae bacterium]|nr:methyltransferase domain-containing protein [Gemmatimonadaceae bacterium]
MWLTPARRRGVEMLDDPAVDPALAERSLRDVALANRLFGGRHAILREVRAVLQRVPPRTAVQLLDVGTGLGDIPRAAMRLAPSLNVSLSTFGLELTPRLASVAGRTCTHAVAADATCLPFANRSVDIVTCSQVLHHFEAPEATRLLQECARVASRAVVIGDLRRSWLAVAGLWTSSFALGFHPVSRHDGVVSILRGFTEQDLKRLLFEATGRVPRVRRSLGWRVTATLDITQT